MSRTISTFTLYSNFEKQHWIKLPDESCRHCGGELLNCTQCSECKKTIGLICQECGARTQEQFHYDCMYRVNNLKTNYSDETSQTGHFLKVSAFA